MMRQNEEEYKRDKNVFHMEEGISIICNGAYVYRDPRGIIKEETCGPHLKYSFQKLMDTQSSQHDIIEICWTVYGFHRLHHEEKTFKVLHSWQTNRDQKELLYNTVRCGLGVKVSQLLHDILFHTTVKSKNGKRIKTVQHIQKDICSTTTIHGDMIYSGMCDIRNTTI